MGWPDRWRSYGKDYRTNRPKLTRRSAPIWISAPAEASRASGAYRAMVKRHRWAERARAWDDHLATRQVKAIVEASVSTAEKLAIDRVKRREGIDEDALVIATQLKIRGLQMLDWPLEQKTTTTSADGKTTTIIIEPTAWRIRDAVRLLQFGDMLARIAVGLPPRGISATTFNQGVAKPVDPALATTERIPAALASKLREAAAAEALDLMSKAGCQPDDDDL
jgi:hypothetical protein